MKRILLFIVFITYFLFLHDVQNEDMTLKSFYRFEDEIRESYDKSNEFSSFLKQELLKEKISYDLKEGENHLICTLKKDIRRFVFLSTKEISYTFFIFLPTYVESY